MKKLTLAVIGAVVLAVVYVSSAADQPNKWKRMPGKGITPPAAPAYPMLPVMPGRTNKTSRVR